jgi:hypothetical protein
MAITIQIDKKGEWDHVSYIGPINEDSEVHLAPLLQQLGPSVVFNFRQVEYVNSCGVRAWITFLREVEKNRKLIYEECTPEIVGQINMIPNFLGTAHIRSIYGSYACTSCDNQKWEIFVEGQNLPTSPGDPVPEVKCNKCSAVMELEELEDEFFAWLDAS